MVKIPPVSEPLPRDHGWNRELPDLAGFDWLRAGWEDFRNRPGLSLAYGVAVFIISLVIVVGMFWLELDYILLPALAGFMVVGPLLAIGLYQKSRDIAEGNPLSLAAMLRVKSRSGGQIVFTGVLLSLLMMSWMRAAVLLYALFFGLLPFPGLDDVTYVLFTTPAGWTLLVTGTLVGGLFAAFSFAISVFSIPILLNERSDAFTAMGSSMALVWHNMRPLLVWGAIVVALFLVCLATALVGLIVVFPLLGHATWHAYRAVEPVTSGGAAETATGEQSGGAVPSV